MDEGADMLKTDSTREFFSVFDADTSALTLFEFVLTKRSPLSSFISLTTISLLTFRAYFVFRAVFDGFIFQSFEKPRVAFLTGAVTSK